MAGTLHPVSLVQHLLSEGRNGTSVAGKVAVLAPAAMTVAKTVLPTIGRLVGGHMLHSTAQAAGEQIESADLLSEFALTCQEALHVASTAVLSITLRKMLCERSFAGNP